VLATRSVSCRRVSRDAIHAASAAANGPSTCSVPCIARLRLDHSTTGAFSARPLGDASQSSAASSGSRTQVALRLSSIRNKRAGHMIIIIFPNG
jgi:hypothetical protein